MLNERTIKNKIEQGFANCGWDIRTGLGTYNWKGGGGSWKEALKPLMDYIRKQEKKK